ncbi:MAG TPA: hypothetical protein VIO35_08400 [Chloroflexota bacterium]|jgi:hypothetical protein
MARTQGILKVKMSAAQAEDQVMVVRQARALQKQILARRGGVPLPSSGGGSHQLRDERSATP